MKKFAKIAAVLILAALLAGCAAPAGERALPRPLEKEGVAPYVLTEDERYILGAFGMSRGAQILAFRAPEEALSLQVDVLRLTEDLTWEVVDGGAVSLGVERIPSSILEGSFTMTLEDGYSVSFAVNTVGSRAQFASRTLEGEHTASTVAFLEEHRDIVLDQPIPVAIMAYDEGTAMGGYGLGDYADPSVLEGVDLVQAVTLTFTGEE